MEANFRRLTELRYRLLPYYSCLAWEAYRTGVPLLRPLLLEYPQDARFARTDDQLMIGADLLLAPVLQPGARERHVELPEGVWHDYWRRELPEGARARFLRRSTECHSWSAAAPSSRCSRRVACIPDGEGYENLELHLWPPFGGEYGLREDDGLTRAYLRGEGCDDGSW